MSLTFNKFSLLFVTQHCHHQTGCWRATGRRSDEVTKWCWWCCLNCRRRWGGEPEGWFHPRRLSKWLRITDIPASLSPLLKPMARDSWRLKPTGGVVWSRTCSFPLKSCKPVKWNGSKSSTEAKQREQAVLSLPAPFVLFEFDCGGWVKPHQGGQTFWVFRTSPALNGRGEVTASDPEPKQARLHVDRPLKANAFVYTSSGSSADNTGGHRLSKQTVFPGRRTIGETLAAG